MVVLNIFKAVLIVTLFIFIFSFMFGVLFRVGIILLIALGVLYLFKKVFVE